MITLSFKQRGSDKLFNRSYVLINSPCYDAFEDKCYADWCTAKACQFGTAGDNESPVKRRRTFRNEKVGTDDFTMITKLAGEDATLLIPFDIDEDGRMDILIQKQKIEYNKIDGSVISVSESIDLIYNNMIFDAFYLKSEMLSVMDNRRGGGTSATIGATFRYLVTGLADDKRV